MTSSTSFFHPSVTLTYLSEICFLYKAIFSKCSCKLIFEEVSSLQYNNNNNNNNNRNNNNNNNNNNNKNKNNNDNNQHEFV